MTTSILQIALASVLWGFSYLFIKLAAGDIAPLVMGFWLSFFAALSLLPLAGRAELLTSFKKFPLHYIALGLLSGPVANVLLATGLQEIDVGIGSVIAKLEAVFVILIAWVLLNEKLSSKQLLWSALALACSPFVVMGELNLFTGATPPVYPAFLIACSGLSYACCVILARFLALRGESALTMIFLRVMFGGLLILPIAFLFGAGIFVGLTTRVTICIFLASATSALAFVFFYKGLKSVPAGLAAVIELLTPAMTVLLGVVFLAEELTVVRVVAMVTLCGAIVELSGARAPKTGAENERV